MSEENVIWNNTQSFSNIDRSEEHVICNGKYSTPRAHKVFQYIDIDRSGVKWSEEHFYSQSRLI